MILVCLLSLWPVSERWALKSIMVLKSKRRSVNPSKNWIGVVMRGEWHRKTSLRWWAVHI